MTTAHEAQTMLDPAAPGPADALPERLLAQEPGAWLPRLTRLLDEQATLCAGLEALSVRQSATLDGADTDALLRILAQRQTILDRVTVINRALAPFRARKEELLARLGPPDRERVARTVGAIAAHVDSVRVRDDQDRRTLERMRTAVADELASLSRARGAAAAYAPPAHASPAPRFQDRRG